MTSLPFLHALILTTTKLAPIAERKLSATSRSPQMLENVALYRPGRPTARVALLLTGATRSFFATGNWQSWAEHVVESYALRDGVSVETFMCTDRRSQSVSAEKHSLHDEAHRRLNVQLWDALEPEDFSPSFANCVIGSTGCLGHAYDEYGRACHGRSHISKDAALRWGLPLEWLSQFASSVGVKHWTHVIDLNMARWVNGSLSHNCPRLSVSLVRASACHARAQCSARLRNITYDWWMVGRPDMTWYAPAPAVATLDGTAIALRARELSGPRMEMCIRKMTPSGNSGCTSQKVNAGESLRTHFSFDRVSENHLSFNFGSKQPCGHRSCPFAAKTRECILVDDQWALLPHHLTGAYFAGGGQCGHSPLRALSQSREDIGCADGADMTALHTRIGWVTASEMRVRVDTPWSARALSEIYGGEGLLTLRLLHLRAPIAVVPAALRFKPVKWNGECTNRPCEPLTIKSCAAKH